ncbi:hypothetical protein [Legionella hackeliae]|uniref:Uncharacterized protein n=1 Tax=Legionella hackeliae TaxID=449 RepID=A0A0A8UUI6_LEGHA|nr:hypothetical protein [Legionella hackeliae]KTD11431.1 hypothetical protein Lhac_1827 [Legionella hackeliae]CEK10742.1 protein of unknown function [Legionella hackeliae]STX47487.1 Uncharacterised protein [Legionella hackeliae]
MIIIEAKDARWLLLSLSLPVVDGHLANFDGTTADIGGGGAGPISVAIVGLTLHQ